MPVHFGWLTISFWPGLAHFGPAPVCFLRVSGGLALRADSR